MKKISILLSMLCLFLVLAACGQNDNTDKEESGASEPQPLEVSLDTPETAEKGQELTFSATVTQGDEAVEDASEVMFEIWKEGDKDNSEMVEAEHEGEGVYSIKKTLEEDGTFVVQSHVTARDLHTMPKNKVTVGSGSEESSEHSEEHAHHGGAVSFHLMKPESIKASEEISLVTHLQKDDQPLAGASVRFEISKDGEEKAQWIDTEETKDGEYEGTATFEEAGKYTVTIHAENDNGLHEHTEETVTVTE
ncbi:FixH family protein [Guptibacillus algicola]|uniref:FixH family protein n=1 Tax=Guptibacillus algicola TaxID=225844 RepID=UPI001CD2551A|nr:FixH family protein [Alkalihalobacillus algicola]MCA0988698.1 FixH family protein [Alkalihalobacillus algicola]